MEYAPCCRTCGKEISQYYLEFFKTNISEARVKFFKKNNIDRMCCCTTFICITKTVSTFEHIANDPPDNQSLAAHGIIPNKSIIDIV